MMFPARKRWVSLKGVAVKDCPIDCETCYQSCTFWRNGKCDYDKIVEELRAWAKENNFTPYTEDEVRQKFPCAFSD